MMANIELVEEETKGKITKELPNGIVIEVDLDTRRITISREWTETREWTDEEGNVHKEKIPRKAVYVTYLNPDNTFRDWKGRLWKVK